ncbi:hypothetical protein J3R30DRAFT_3687425 [Lentinula aciculospora]|uniref:Uncharacterized protein n=1 Tax=Lentinula aciculospora TaxID=153920 RepID=A0A9W8ZXY2_9AGAR|nr:hypothetical protein J3R30DRAFT_3687425 [Lentinula aciculospora]
MTCLAVNPPSEERDAYEHAICQTTFPKLDTFIWSATCSLRLLKFLTQHHQQLYTVAFNFEPLETLTILRYSLADAEPITLRGLVKFYGELHHVRLLGAEDTIKSITGQWTGQELTNFRSCMMSLRRIKHLVELNLMWPVLDIMHLDIISRHLQTIQDLKITLSSVYVREDEASIFLFCLCTKSTHPHIQSNDVRIKAALSRFPDLIKLTILNAGHREPGKPKFGLDEDYKSVRVWGDRCPSLAICITPRHTRWIRCEERDAVEWVPTPLVGEARKWYKNAILNDIKPGWKKAIRRIWPPGIEIEDAISIADSELMELLEYSDDEQEDVEEQKEAQEQVEVEAEVPTLDSATSELTQNDFINGGQGDVESEVAQDAASNNGAEAERSDSSLDDTEGIIAEQGNRDDLS